MKMSPLIIGTMSIGMIMNMTKSQIRIIHILPHQVLMNGLKRQPGWWFLLRTAARLTFNAAWGWAIPKPVELWISLRPLESSALRMVAGPVKFWYVI